MDNNEAIGYMLLACKKVEISLEDIKKIYSSMYFMFDVKIGEEAEEQGLNWYYRMLEAEEQKIEKDTLNMLRKKCYGA